MRKMMNKKGFSLVELMIVVVIMGILIAVAIPLYGAITTNANAKTCANNIKVIKNTCANYYSANEQVAIDTANTLAGMMEAKKTPSCPLDNDEDTDDGYQIVVDTKEGTAKVYCLNYEGHEDKKTTIGSEAAKMTAGTNERELQASGTTTYTAS